MKTGSLRTALLFGVSLVMLLPSSAFSWWNTGHEIVAQLAEDHLTVTAKANLKTVLAVDVEYPGNLKLSRLSDSLVTCAPWADTIKQETDWYTSTQENFFSSLHFIDVLIPQNAVPSMEASEQNFQATILHNPVGNVDYAIKSAIKVLASTDNDPVLKAVALRFLVHFVGDIHQPFHSSDPVLDGKITHGGNLVPLNTPPYFPGRKNHYSTEISGKEYNEADEIHAFWDATGGAFKQLTDPTYAAISKEDLAYIKQTASSLDTRYAGAYDSEIDNPNVDAWAVESHYDASKAYTTDILDPRFVNREDKFYINNNLAYEQFAASISEVRVYLAGRRLGNLLNTLFDPDGVVPSYDKYLQGILTDPAVYNIYTFSNW